MWSFVKIVLATSIQLRHTIPRGALLQAARILRAALRTLIHCHSRGILHRDIKPGNFMFLTEDESSPIKAVGENVASH